MNFAEQGYTQLNREEAVLILRQVRQSYPVHPFREIGFVGVWIRRLPFYQRYRDYIVDFGPYHPQLWGFYAAKDDIVIRHLEGQERAEFLVNRRDPIHLDPGNVVAYVHHMQRGLPTYLDGDPDRFVFVDGASEHHRALVQEFVRPPRLEKTTHSGGFWVSTIHYREYDEEGHRSSTLAEQWIEVDSNGTMQEQPWRIRCEGLQAYLLRPSRKVEIIIR